MPYVRGPWISDGVLTDLDMHREKSRYN